MITWKSLLQPWHNELTIQNDEIVVLIRQWRNLKLAASDWTQLPDITFINNEVEAWKQYRQELRDMLKQNHNPKLIVFPEPPK